MRFPTAAETSAGVVMFRGLRTTVSAQKWLLCGWFWFGPGSSQAAYPRFLSYERSGFGIGWNAKWVETNPAVVSLGFGNNGLDYGFIDVDAMRWIYLAVACDIQAAQSQFKGAHKYVGLPIVSDFDTGTRFENYLATDRLRLDQNFVAGQGGITGRVAAVSIYNLDTINTGLIYPAELAEPLETRKIFQVNPSTGNDSNVEGPFATDQGLKNALRNSAIAGATKYVPWRDAGENNRSYAQFTNTDWQSKRDWAIAYDANPKSRQPQGDIVEFVSGDHFLTVREGVTFRAQVPGVDIRGQSPTNRPRIYALEKITGTWVNVSGNEWKMTTGSWMTGGMIVQRTTDDANGQKQFLPMYPITVALGAHTTSMANYEGSFLSTTASDLRIHPYGNGNPNSSEFYICMLDGATEASVLSIGDGRVIDLEIIPGYEYAVGGAFEAHYGATSQFFGLGVIAVFDNVLVRLYGKHGWAHVIGSPGSTGVKSLFVTRDVETRQGPMPLQADVNVGFGSGAWSAGVDFCGGDTQAADGTGPVGVHFRPIDNLNVSAPNSVAGVSNSSYNSYQYHNLGGQFQIAFVGIYNQNWKNFTTLVTGAGTVLQNGYPA